MKKLFTILTFAATSFASDYTVNQEEMKILWAEWKSNHAKNYTEDEEHHRMNTFVENYNIILAHNANPDNTVTLGLNHFADMTGDEFKSQYLSGYTPAPEAPEQSVGESADQSAGGDRNLRGANRQTASLPASVDWRTKGAVGPVKNQGHCGGCWAWSTTGALEGLHQIKTGKLLSFSEQQLLNCNRMSNGCRGGEIQTSFTYTAEYGDELESESPFLGTTGTCHYSASKALKVNSGHVQVPARDLNAVLAAIVRQPVSVAIEATQSVFQFYRSGVITSGCGSATNHAVLAVGYTTVNGHQAFIVKNSWGAGWGQNGYVYISTNSGANGGEGVCGILSIPVYPTA